MKNIINFLKIKELNKKKDTNNSNNIRIGSLLLIYYYVIAKGKLCRRVFPGICIAKKHNSIETSITVRRIIKKVGIDMTFFLYSPVVIGYKVMKQKRINRRHLLKKFKYIFNK